MSANIKRKRLRWLPSIFRLAKGHNAIVNDKHKWHIMCNQLSIKHKWSIFKQTHSFVGNNLERRILANRSKLQLAMGKSVNQYNTTR